MSHENQTTTDLFGNVVHLVARTKGRPPFERTEENAHKISMLLAMGWSNERIASVVRDPRTGKTISVPTLKRYFRSELQMRGVVRDQMVSSQLMQAWRAASGGNVGAMRFFDKLVEKNDLMMIEAKKRQAPQDAKPEEAQPAKLGKKEYARIEAADAEARVRAKVQQEANGTRYN